MTERMEKPRESTAAGAEAPRVMAAMSGGVDSSVMALLLKEQGYGVVGATMVLREPTGHAEGGCGSSREVEDARSVCRRLGIPHRTYDLADRFEEAVVEPFCRAWCAGLTPNPCVVCNRRLKFEALQQARRAEGFGFVATGHYARRAFDERSGRWQLLRARDESKDQSYFLYHLTQDTLAHMLFTLGELTKPEVRAIARERGFVTADKPESQDICFVPDGDYVGFIERRLGNGCGGDEACAESEGAPLASAFEPGDIVNRAGEVLGRHWGLIHYTAGQRKGIGVAAREPLYVIGKDPKRNQLVVGFADEARCAGVVARDVNLIGGEFWEGPRPVQVKTHYRQQPVEAVAERTGEDELTITFAEPQRVAAPGQAAVLYDGDEILGGGTIAGVL
ncbi:tRNA 2-thiouridine(34) synthase MnmA [uncultured Adlercreutzia sp.]|uniref:tRNA 2-thiouridine(34) synthase MnmA n=1 Tax=uncultured Adlercreutzia sp. TaxID=875803 RepID=UPI0025F4E87A|nr:tRNA 2-thiouridine(34) synthase MnmA [uncultured Adlercreutzia sp.]